MRHFQKSIAFTSCGVVHRLSPTELHLVNPLSQLFLPSALVFRVRHVASQPAKIYGQSFRARNLSKLRYTPFAYSTPSSFYQRIRSIPPPSRENYSFLRVQQRVCPVTCLRMEKLRSFLKENRMLGQFRSWTCLEVEL